MASAISTFVNSALQQRQQGGQMFDKLRQIQAFDQQQAEQKRQRATTA